MVRPLSRDCVSKYEFCATMSRLRANRPLIEIGVHAAAEICCDELVWPHCTR